MGAYHEAYLQKIVETQGELFENVAEYEPGIDVKDFIETYMSGKTRAFVDKAKAYVCTMDAKSLWDYFIRELVRLLPIDFLTSGYRGLHDLDLELAVRKVGEQCGCKKGDWIS